MMPLIPVSEIRKVLKYRGVNPQRHEIGYQGGEGKQYTSQSDLLLSQKSWLYDDQADSTEQYTCIGDDTISDALTLYNTQNEKFIGYKYSGLAGIDEIPYSITNFPVAVEVPCDTVIK